MQTRAQRYINIRGYGRETRRRRQGVEVVRRQGRPQESDRVDRRACRGGGHLFFRAAGRESPLCANEYSKDISSMP